MHTCEHAHTTGVSKPACCAASMCRESPHSQFCGALPLGRPTSKFERRGSGSSLDAGGVAASGDIPICVGDVPGILCAPAEIRDRCQLQGPRHWCKQAGDGGPFTCRMHQSTRAGSQRMLAVSAQSASITHGKAPECCEAVRFIVGFSTMYVYVCK